MFFSSGISLTALSVVVIALLSYVRIVEKPYTTPGVRFLNALNTLVSLLFAVAVFLMCHVPKTKESFWHHTFAYSSAALGTVVAVLGTPLLQWTADPKPSQAITVLRALLAILLLLSNVVSIFAHTRGHESL